MMLKSLFGKEVADSILALYNEFINEPSIKQAIENKDTDRLISACKHILAYSLDTNSLGDNYIVEISTDNKEVNTVEYINLYINRETFEISNYIDVSLITEFDDSELFEDVKIKS